MQIKRQYNMHLLMKALQIHLQTQASHHIDHILLTFFFIFPWVQPLLIWILTPAGKIPISLYAVKTDSNQITFIADQKKVQHALINESSPHASPDSTFTSHWSHSSNRFLHFSMSATYMLLQVSFDYKIFPAKLTSY